MSNVLSPTTQQQVRALGRLGWTLRRIEQATGVRRETASAYLKAAGIAVRGRGGGPAVWPPPNPATTGEVSTDLPPPTPPGRAPSASACEPYRELITAALERGRNAVAIWQDLVDDHGFSARYASVRRFVRQLRDTEPVEARVVIITAPGAVRKTLLWKRFGRQPRGAAPYSHCSGCAPRPGVRSGCRSMRNPPEDWGTPSWAVHGASARYLGSPLDLPGRAFDERRRWLRKPSDPRLQDLAIAPLQLDDLDRQWQGNHNYHRPHYCASYFCIIPPAWRARPGSFWRTGAGCACIA